MSVLKSTVAPSIRRAVPPLQNGDRLNRLEFERRFEATPGLKHAELINGVVLMPPPVAAEHHGEPNTSLIGWIFTYKVATPGIRAGNDSSLRLDLDNMPQPDAYLMIDSKCGGQAKLSDDGYVVNAPELVCEIAASSVSADLHDKLNIYRRSGVREYIVWRTYDGEVDYFILRDGEFVRLEPAEPGKQIYYSTVFPGLRLDADALLRGDLKTVLDVLQQGIASPEHGAFVELLRSRAKP